MARLDRETSLPCEMQGRWVDVEDPLSELIVNGGEITCFGQPVQYDYKEVTEENGALVVSLMIDDLSKEDTFQRANVTALAISPEGKFYAYNVRFACQFVRPD